MRHLILLLASIFIVAGVAFAGDSNMKLSDVYPDAIDSRTEGTNGEHRQVVVIGDDSTNTSVANVDSTGALSVVDYDAVAEDAAHVSGDEGVLAIAVRNDNLAALAGTDGDNAPLQVDAVGGLFTSSKARGDVVADNDDEATVKFATIATDGADADDVVAAVASKKIKVLGYVVYCSAATDITWEDGDGTDISGTINLVANGNLGVVAPVNPIGYFETPVANKSLALLKSGAVDCDGHLTYIEVD